MDPRNVVGCYVQHGASQGSRADQVWDVDVVSVSSEGTGAVSEDASGGGAREGGPHRLAGDRRGDETDYREVVPKYGPMGTLVPCVNATMSAVACIRAALTRIGQARDPRHSGCSPLSTMPVEIAGRLALGQLRPKPPSWA
jgi:hypothetical protein